MKLVYIADLHLRASAPINRKDDYVEAQFRKLDFIVDYVNKIIQVKEDSNEVGNGTWGKIDYLCHYCGYIYVRPKTNNNN